MESDPAEQKKNCKIALQAWILYALGSVVVPDHDGGWPEEVNACFLNSYMVYL